MSSSYVSVIERLTSPLIAFSFEIWSWISGNLAVFPCVYFKAQRGGRERWVEVVVVDSIFFVYLQYMDKAYSLHPQLTDVDKYELLALVHSMMI